MSKIKLALGDKVAVGNTRIQGQIVAKVEYYKGHTEMLVRYEDNEGRVQQDWINEQQLSLTITIKKAKVKK